MDMNKKNIVIFGTGHGAEQIVRILDESNVNIIAFIDNDSFKQGESYRGKRVVNPKEIMNLTFDFIIIGSISYEAEMKSQLIIEGVPTKLILSPLTRPKGTKVSHYEKKYDEYLVYKDVFLENIAEAIYKENAFCSINYQSSQKRLVSIYDYPDYALSGIDYVRVSTVELLAREIIEKQVNGLVAELGVYQGNFTKLLSDIFTDRKLYLFDTFEGFSEKDIITERAHGYSKAQEGRFKDTNVNIVLEKLQKNQQVVVRKGYFPDTTTGLQDDTYAFVSIDVDLYKPTYDGLNYFYDRLSKGGYIIIHDYNFETYDGVKSAVRQFSGERNVSYVPISDYFGSVIITK